MSDDLTNTRVLVVCVGGGIGRAPSEAFARTGARVVVAGRPGAGLDAAAHAAKANTTGLVFIDDAAVDASFAGCEPFDHAVVAAASTKTGSVEAPALADARTSRSSMFSGAYRLVTGTTVTVDGGTTA